MKITALCLIGLITIGTTLAQDESVTYKVTNFEIDGVNIDHLALEEDVALAFYLSKDETLCFANCWRNTDSQSYGKVYGLKACSMPERKTTYPAKVLKFTWRFRNTYDEVTGEAAVTFTEIYIRNMVKFTAEIVVLDTNEVIVLKGYQE